MHPRRAIDVGCGTGRWTERLSAIGVDASPAMLAVAARKPGLRGRLAVADATALPIASGSADLVLCALTLGHIRDQAAAMREFARVLAPGGTLLLTDFHPAAAAHGWRRTFRRDGRVYELENMRTRSKNFATRPRGWSLRSARRRRSESPSARSSIVPASPSCSQPPAALRRCC